MAQAMNAMENLKPEQMESMMKWATRLQKCMAFCAKPYALFKWTVGWIPAEYRRPVMIALGSV